MDFKERGFERMVLVWDEEMDWESMRESVGRVGALVG